MQRRWTCAASRDQRRDLLQVAGEVWWSGCARGAAAEGAQRGEREAEEAAGQGDARERMLNYLNAKNGDARSKAPSRGSPPRDLRGEPKRRAYDTIGCDRSSMRYRSVRPDDDVARARLRELAAIRRRFGYRRLHILLRREGVTMNHKKLRWLYTEERLKVRRRGRHKRALGARAPIALQQGPTREVARLRERHADRQPGGSA